jgi:hypothetical protein
MKGTGVIHDAAKVEAGRLCECVVSECGAWYFSAGLFGPLARSGIDDFGSRTLVAKPRRNGEEFESAFDFGEMQRRMKSWLAQSAETDRK